MVSSQRVLPWMGVGLIVLAVIAGVFVSRRSERSLEERRYQALTELKGRPEVAHRNVMPAHFGRIRVLGTSELLESDAEGRPVLRIQFERIEYDASRENVGLRGAVCWAYDDGQVTAKFSAPDVIIHTDRSEMNMGGGVRAESMRKPFIIEASTMVWRWRDGEVSASGGVYVKRGGLIGEAEELSTDTTLAHVRLRGNPHLRFGRQRG